jgi:hypothetical protein
VNITKMEVWTGCTKRTHNLARKDKENCFKDMSGDVEQSSEVRKLCIVYLCFSC